MAEVLQTEDLSIDPQKNDHEKQEGPKKEPSIDENKLSKNEVQQLKGQKVTIPKLAAQRMQLKKAAEDELNRMVTVTQNQQSVIDLKEYKELKKELDETQSPELTHELLEKIKDLPKEKEKQRAREKEETKELAPDDPKLLELERKFISICRANKHLIGQGQLDGFEEWFRQERQKNPTVKHLKTLIGRLEGQDIYDKGGLAPRRQEFETLKILFKKYGMADPLQNEWIKKEGLSERQEFRKQLEAIEDHFRQVKDTPFYSEKTVRERMRENLKAKDPAELKKRLDQAKKIARQESEGFTHLNATMQIAGMTIRKMSEASREKYLEYYKTTDFREREKLVSNWRTLVEYEAALTKDLEKIYKDDTGELKLALGSFEELDFMEKEKSLKEHKKMVESTKNKEELQRNLTIKAAHSKIDAAARKKIIAPGNDKTQGRYRKFFENPENFRNPNNKKPGDTAELKKAYQLLISSTPDEQRKNLTAYEARRKKYEKDLKRLQETNPAVSPEELKKWQDRYDKEGWTRREKIAEQDLPREIEKQKKEQQKKRAEEAEIGITESEKREAKERAPERTMLELTINECLAENTPESVNQGRKALRLYLVAHPKEENDKVLIYLEEQLAKAARELGSKKNPKKNEEKEIEKQIEKVAEQKTIEDRLYEAQIKTLNIEGAKQSEDRHNRQTRAHERARKESLGRTKSGSLEADLTKNAYDQLGKDYILDREGTGEKVTEVEFNKTSMTTEERLGLGSKTWREQGKLDTKEGLLHQLKDAKSGRTISARESEKIQAEELEELEKDMATQVEEKTEKKEAVESSSGKTVFDLNAKMAARRKAKETIDKRRHEKIKA